MRKHRTFLATMIAALVIASVGVSTPARAAFLSDLIAGSPPTLSSTSGPPQPPPPIYTVIGSNWAYSFTGNMPAATAVTVLPNTDFLGNAGFEFQGAFHDNPGGGNSDALIQYQVTLSPADLAKGLVFTDVHLESDVNVVGGSTTNIGSISITETVRDTSGTLIGTLTNFDIWTAAGHSNLAQQTILLDPSKHYTVLNISKDILASSDSANALPSASHIDQSYSVPEPASIALMGIGMVGMVGYAIRRRKSLAV